MDKVKWNTIRVVSLAGGKISVYENIRQLPSPPKDEKRLIIMDGSDEPQELINVMKLGIKLEHSLLNKDRPFYKYLKEHQNKTKGWIQKKYHWILIILIKIWVQIQNPSTLTNIICLQIFQWHMVSKRLAKIFVSCVRNSRWTSKRTIVQYYKVVFIMED